jgi:hypothetical protein
MKLVQSLLAFALAGAMAASAHADFVYSIPVPLGSTPYTNTATVTANFTDTYTFSVANSTVAGTTVSVNLDLGNNSYHISNLKLDLFDTNDVWLAGDIVSGPSDVSVSAGAQLTAGDYYFTVGGIGDGTGTGQGIYTFTTAAVPEAKSYAMMLAGLGLIGFVVVRRRTV